VIDGDPPIPSLLEQPVKPGTVLTFEEKYKAGDGKKGGGKSGGKGQGMAGQQRLIPAPLHDEMTANIQELAVKTFQAIGAGGVARVDFLIAKTGEVYVNELNNIPGSLSYYLWEPVGKSFGDLIDRMIDRAFEVNKQRNRTTFSFEANLLAGR
jgi:D-alanine-D-alanine ligase